ncbi:hypothetical protein GGX14DRAFT_406600 [Mycena pura]|uniref:Uncharacterized protein n=1 Tax=Mycena pura TaxID=153505 RepID=A0AAD6UTV0_9AGAR|nr:hypothetical protein GGX14DRAFT_406600 [Mycena pura]
MVRRNREAYVTLLTASTSCYGRRVEPVLNEAHLQKIFAREGKPECERHQYHRNMGVESDELKCLTARGSDLKATSSKCRRFCARDEIDPGSTVARDVTSVLRLVCLCAEAQFDRRVRREDCYSSTVVGRPSYALGEYSCEGPPPVMFLSLDTALTRRTQCEAVKRVKAYQSGQPCPHACATRKMGSASVATTKCRPAPYRRKPPHRKAFRKYLATSREVEGTELNKRPQCEATHFTSRWSRNAAGNS